MNNKKRAEFQLFFIIFVSSITSDILQAVLGLLLVDRLT